MKFKDKVVIITGGGQGIGRAISRTFASEGAEVVIADIDEEAGSENEKFIIDHGHKANFIQTDVANEESVKNMVNNVVSKLGTIHILINNAAIGSTGNIFDNPVEIWDRVIAVNLRGPYMCSKYCAQHMAKNPHSSIINIASTRAFMSEADTEAYSASKGGIVALTHSLAVSLSKYKIRVNSISPGWIETSDWQKNSMSKEPVLSEADHLQHPAGRVGKPEDIAKACLFLCSEDAGFITGTNLTIDGGMTIKMIYV